MQYTLATLALVAAAFAAPDAVTSAIAPASSVPAGCMTTYPSSFEIEIVNRTANMKRSLESRQDSNLLVLTLNNGNLMDNKGRTGYIAGSNTQLQFDSPPQAGAIYTSGFSVCSNGTLAIGGTTSFIACLQEATANEGAYYDIYLRNQGPQCTPIYIYVVDSSSGAAQQASDGQVTAVVTQKTDGQPQATSVAPKITQKTDGQPQATTILPMITQKTDGQPQATTILPKPITTYPASQLSDGQIRASTILSATPASTSKAVFTGAAAPIAARGELLGLAAGVFAAALL